MKTTDLMTIVTAALATAALTVTTFWSGPLEADNPGDNPATRIAKPTLVAHGIEMTLAAPTDRTFIAGEEPVFELTAVNTTDQPSAASVSVSVTATSPSDTMSRVPRLPKALWQQNLPVTLQANETKTLAIAVPAKLPPHSMIAVLLRDADPAPALSTTSPASKPLPRRAGPPESGISALNFSTAAPLVQTAAAR